MSVDSMRIREMPVEIRLENTGHWVGKRLLSKVTVDGKTWQDTVVLLWHVVAIVSWDLTRTLCSRPSPVL